MTDNDVSKILYAVSPKFGEDSLLSILNGTFGLKDATIKNILVEGETKKGDSYLSTVSKFTIEAAGKDKR